MLGKVVAFGKMKIKYIFLFSLFFSLWTNSSQAQGEEGLCQIPAIIPRPIYPTATVITDSTISLTGLTIPSLWWDIEQLIPSIGNLVRRWDAYIPEQRIDLQVNSLLWRSLDYTQRYSFVNHVGMIAREFQYNLQVFTYPRQCLATYTCIRANGDSPEICSIKFDPQGLQRLDSKK